MNTTHQAAAQRQGGITNGTVPASDDAMDVATHESHAPSAEPPSSLSMTTSSEPRNEEAHDGEQHAATGAAQAASSSQARVVQTAFVQKLYNMLDSDANRKAIAWSPTGESFIVNPGADFQNVLASYFKHTNPQSFVRQLNMYGFHKVNDVFQGSAPETHLWEFKHGEGSFRRGDIDGLREIKRRPSKHHLPVHHHHHHHRESPHPALPHLQPAATPTTAAVVGFDQVITRLEAAEHANYNLHYRLSREEETRAHLSAKTQQLQDRCQQLTDALITSQNNTRELAGMLTGLLPDTTHHVHRDVARLRGDLDSQLEMFRRLEPLNQDRHTAGLNHESLIPSTPPLHACYDDPRKTTLVRTRTFQPNHTPAAASPRRLAPHPSVNPFSPPPAPPLPPPPLSLNGSAASYQSPSHSGQQSQQSLVTGMSPPSSLPRRHTSADVRENPGWRSAYGSSEHLPLPSVSNAGSGLPSSQPSAVWPSSPQHRPSHGAEQLRETLGRYQIDSRNASMASDATVTMAPSPQSRRQSEQHSHYAGAGGAHSNAQESSMFGGGGGASGVGGRPLFNPSVWNQASGGSASSTRRSSMAHLLNPADTAERADEDDDVAPDERSKRKRVD